MKISLTENQNFVDEIKRIVYNEDRRSIHTVAGRILEAVEEYENLDDGNGDHEYLGSNDSGDRWED